MRHSPCTPVISNFISFLYIAPVPLVTLQRLADAMYITNQIQQSRQWHIWLIYTVSAISTVIISIRGTCNVEGCKAYAFCGPNRKLKNQASIFPYSWYLKTAPAALRRAKYFQHGSTSLADKREPNIILLKEWVTARMLANGGENSKLLRPP